MSKYNYFIGIDTGRYSNLAVVINKQGTKLESIKFDNNHKGCSMLMERLAKRTQNSLIGLEGQGVCSNILTNRLSSSCFTIKPIMPINIKRHKDYFTQDVKNDEYDAYVIADYLRLRHEHIKNLDVKRSKALNAIKELSKLYKDFAKQKCAYLNMLNQAVMEIFPEYISIFSKINCKSSLALLSQLPTQKDIAGISLGRLNTILSKNSRGHITTEKIKHLYAQATLSLNDSLDYTASGLRISSLAKMISYLQQEQARIKKIIKSYLKDIPEANILLTLPGVDTILAARFISSIGSIDRFDNSNGLALYCGVACLDDKSGKKQRTKRAYRVNHTAKDAIMQIANCSIRFNPASKAYYTRKRKEGKRHWQAVKSLARNIIRVIYVMLKNNTKYNPDISKDSKNTRQITHFN